MNPHWLIGALQPLGAAVEIALATSFLARELPSRERFWPRVGVCAALELAGVLFFSWLGMEARPELTVNGTPQLIGQFAVFTLLYAYTAASVRACYDTSGVNALFCASAGYTMQNIVSSLEMLVVLVAGRVLGIPDGDVPMRTCANTVAMCVGFGLCYLGFVRAVRRSGIYEVRERSIVGFFAAVVLLVILFDVLNKALGYSGVPLALVLGFRAIHGVACAFVLGAQYELLFARRLQVEAAASEQMAAEAARQYELSRGNIEAINVKCHDIRHQIRGLASGPGGAAVPAEVLADIAAEVDVYDSGVRTGNDALDTILTEKSLLCRAEGITFTCIADGHALDFMAPPDIYALFGNALDNAAEAARAVGEGGARSVSLSVRRVGAMVAVHVENSCAGEVELGADGRPVTSKLGEDGQPDTAHHGFGTLSMQRIAERYDGIISAEQRGETYCLDIMLPAAE